MSWSVSFYPQPLLNWRRRSTKGFTADTAALNTLGFICYTISTAAFLFSPTILHQYALRHPLAPEPTVRLNDFAFALHAVVCTIITYSQFWYRLWRFEGESARSSPAARGVIAGSITAVAVVALIASGNDGKGVDAKSWASIDVVCELSTCSSVYNSSSLTHHPCQVYALAHTKLLITFVKYTPQAWHNYQVKSTEGWAIHTILLDLIGGVLSLVQLVIDSALQSDWSGISGNPVKFGLSIVSIFFDVIFVIQHYVLYPREAEVVEDAENGERAPLLG